MDEMLAREFVAAASEMNRLLTRYERDPNLGNRDSHDLLVECATIGCALLRNPEYVQALVDDARRFEEEITRHRPEMQYIMTTQHFNFFLGIEEDLLRLGGADPSLTDRILQRCRETREAVRPDKFNAGRFHLALVDLRDQVCRVLTELLRTTFDQRPPSRLSQRLRACFIGVCGCVVVGLDASMLAPTTGLSEAGSAASVAVGGAILSQAIADISGGGLFMRHLRESSLWGWWRRALRLCRAWWGR